MGSSREESPPPTPSSLSPLWSFVTPLAAPPAGRDGSQADGSVPFEGREEKQMEGILETIEDSDWLRSESKRISEYMNTGASLHAAQDMGSNHRLVLDSVSSIHSTGDLRLLSEFTLAPEGSTAVLRTRDGRDLRVAGEGTIACDKFHLPRVNYVPGLASGFTLVSVQQLAACDYLVMFGGGGCYVKNRSNGSLVGRGLSCDEDGFYRLEFLRIPPVAVEDDGVN